MTNNNKNNNHVQLILQNPQNTIVGKYIPSTRKQKYYQTEQDLEREFIEQLIAQGYEYLNIKTNEDLVKNLRKQLERLNNLEFTDNEWERLFKKELANPNKGIIEKTELVQEESIITFKFDSGDEKNIKFFDKKNLHNNHLQVINQYSTEWGKRVNRYDVTILVNGFPLVHIELKRRWVSLKEAFNQINRYQRESFWADSGLFEYVQIFVISNWTHTKYYSNTTRVNHIEDQNNKNEWKKIKHTFEFTSWWTDVENNRIEDLIDFTKTFFLKHTLLNILFKYCVFTSEKQLLVMRPYQIAATEKIINKIEISHTYKKYWTRESGWYIWHTTWSWKTLTSFKTAQLATKLDYIDKVMFIVDRKDLDYQTIKEYNKFKEGCVDGTTSIKALKEQIEDPKKKIIITTIQKLNRFLKRNKKHPIYNKEVVLIFDECHRSQFGEMHKLITKTFKKYYLFWFTWTPIFKDNSISWFTTEQIFWERLHVYTVIDAIADWNVLPFKVAYNKVWEWDKNKKESYFNNPNRIKVIVEDILKKFDNKTMRNKKLSLEKRRKQWFNSILAVSSIDMLKLYYNEFKKQQEHLPDKEKLRIATIFSYSPNEEINEIDESLEEINKLDWNSRDFLEDAINDYNEMFWISYDTSSEKFQNYYKDVSKRVKNKEIDLLIVVNMFLTWFDAPTLNTLWVDKKLKDHTLIQAFSRTNRIFNSIKTCWVIECYRDLQDEVDKAVALFGNKDLTSFIFLKTFEDYYYGYTEKWKQIEWYKDLVERLTKQFPIGKKLISEKEKKEFIDLYGKYLKSYNTLRIFDEFEWKEILSERERQDYDSIYIDLYDEFRKSKEIFKEEITDDMDFYIEFLKEVDINVDYILNLIEKNKEKLNDEKQKEKLINQIDKSIKSSLSFRNKSDIVKEFLYKINSSSSILEDWTKFVKEKAKQDLDKIIKDMNLEQEKIYEFIENSFEVWHLIDKWELLWNIVPSISFLTKNNDREKIKQKILIQLEEFFNKYYDIVNINIFSQEND